MGVSGVCPLFPGTPVISGTGKATVFILGPYIHRIHPNKPFNNFGDKGVWAYAGYSGTAQFLQVPPIISGIGKATAIGLCLYSLQINV